MSNRTSELIAKRRAIEEALRKWDEHNEEYFIRLEVSYLPAVPKPKREREVIVARREVISQYLKRECLQYWREKGDTLYLLKSEYFELWDMLKANQPQPEEDKGIIKKLFKL